MFNRRAQKFALFCESPLKLHITSFISDLLKFFSIQETACASPYSRIRFRTYTCCFSKSILLNSTSQKYSLRKSGNFSNFVCLLLSIIELYNKGRTHRSAPTYRTAVLSQLKNKKNFSFPASS